MCDASRAGSAVRRNNEWEASVSNRSRRGHNCPYCADRSKRLRSIAAQRPDLLKEWNYEKNAKPPQEVTARSNKKCGGSAVHAVTSGRFLLTAGAA
ncbi:hypothetical protein EGR95_13240 [bacterium]|nr:hypothetical protein [bacterium]MBD9253819.1 hypothetical protein [bacterium]